jgi:hypothetical protein
MSNNRGNQSMMGSMCAPAKLYGMISLVSIAGFLYNQQVGAAFGNVAFAGIWVFLLNWICQEGWSGLSWFLLLLPVIVAIILMMIGAVAVATSPELMQQINQEVQREMQQRERGRY